MNKSFKIDALQKTVTKIRITVNAPLEEYAKIFLTIHNNTRDDNRLLKMYNNRKNDIYILVKQAYVEDVTDWLEGFEFVEITNIYHNVPYAELIADYDVLERIYGDEKCYEVEFSPIVETY